MSGQRPYDGFLGFAIVAMLFTIVGFTPPAWPRFDPIAHGLAVFFGLLALRETR